MTLEEQVGKIAGAEAQRLMDAAFEDLAYLYRKLIVLMATDIVGGEPASMAGTTHTLSDLQQARALDYAWYLMVRALGATTPPEQKHHMVLEEHDHS